ncbi:hypothetical protein Dda_2206 [Drechslerella dactyloides]|uniref:Uncharacterized protein n=1 Tax=Drechslerella dactyloides TaxID=74499 RepID=A0AAD6J332_DREDA|nr:hypothetical protein Dda_2206 [Drechslerella dactyloides]
MSGESYSQMPTPHPVGAWPVTPGPRRSVPRNRSSWRAYQGPASANSSARAASNAIREAAAVGVSKTRRGWFKTIYNFIMPATRTAHGASTDSTTPSSQSWWQYVSNTALSYIGRQPKRQYQSMLDPALFINHRKKEFQEMQDRIRRAEEREKQKEWASQIASQVQQLGESLHSSTPSTQQQPLDNVQQWRDVLRSTIHDPYANVTKRPSSSSSDDKADKANMRGQKRTHKNASNPESNKENSVNAPAPVNKSRRTGRSDLTKDHFKQNFKTDASRDAENLQFIKKYTGWSLHSMVNNFREQRFPKLRQDFSFDREEDEVDMAKLAEILSDRGFLRRHGINDKVSFVPIWGTRPLTEDQICRFPKIHIPTSMTEPNPSRRVRKFSSREREEMHEKMDFEAVKDEWSKQTIYDLEFRLPSDPPLQPRDVELPQEPFEIHRDDPRFRHLWRLLPCVRIKSYDKTQNAAQARLQYKRQLSKRDLWFWKLIHAVARHDRGLAKVLTRFDLNRKRGEMYWDHYKRVQLIQTDDLPAGLEVEEEDLIIRDDEEEYEEPEIKEHWMKGDKVKNALEKEQNKRALPGYTISQTYLPDAISKNRESGRPSVPMLPPDQRRPNSFKSYTSYSAKAWENEEADLSDGDNFPSAKGYQTDYLANGDAHYQAERLAKALVKSNLLPSGTAKKTKKVSFVQGHTLTIFDPQEVESPESSPEMHATKKRKATDGASLKVEKAALGSPPETRKRAATVANVDISAPAPATPRTAPQTFTRPTTIGQGSSNPNKRRYQESFSDSPREWRSLTNCYSAWDEDFEDAGIFYEIDIKDGRLPKGVGTWEAELRQTCGPKRVRVMRLNGGDQDFVVWDLDGVLRDPDWVPPVVAEPAPVPEKRTAVEKTSGPTSAFNVSSIDSVPRPDQLPDLSAALRGQVKPKTLQEERAEYRAKPESDSAEKKGKGKARRASMVEEEPEDPFSFKSNYANYQRELEKEQKEKEAAKAAKAKGEAERAAARAAAEEFYLGNQPSAEERERGRRVLEQLEKRNSGNRLGNETLEEDEELFRSPCGDGADDAPPRKTRRRVEKSSIEIDPSFPIFNPFETSSPTKPRTGLKRSSSSKSENALPSPPLSGDEEHSGKDGNAPGSKAKARLTGLFDPVSSQKGWFIHDTSNAVHATNGFLAPFTVVEDGSHHLNKTAATGKVTESFESDLTTASSAPSEPQVGEESTNVLQPVVVNGASLPRQGSLSDITKNQGLLPSAPISSMAPPMPVTPSAALTAAELGMFGAVKPSPNGRGFDDDSGMDIDNTPQSAKKTRSPKEFGLVTDASAQMAASFKPSVPASFDFGSMNSKPIFGNENAVRVANANTSTPFVFGGAPATAKPKDIFAPATSSSDVFLFGGGATSSAPTNFGQPAVSKPAETPFVFGGKATATPVSTGLFGSTAAPAPAASSLFGASTSAPSNFGTSAPAIGGIFGTSATSAPSSNMFGAASNPPTSNGLFGAVSGVTSAPSFQAAGASSAPLFGAQTSTAPVQSFNTSSAPTFGGNSAATSSSFTFGSTATTQSSGPFGPELTKPTSASFSTGFTFGGSGTNSPAPGGNFTFGGPAVSNAASPAPSAPVFGASNPATPTPTPAANLGGGGDPANPFGFQPQQTNSFGRTIKAPVSRKPGSVRGRR